MSAAFIIPAVITLVKIIKLLVLLLFNHLVNIPLTMFLGVGKYVSFVIALIMDAVQIVIYYNVLNKTALGKKYGWKINSTQVENYHKPKLLQKLGTKWLYVSVLFLSLLPLYLGGVFASVFTAHSLNLDKKKSLIFISIGCLTGCFIWTIGIWNLAEFLFAKFKG